MPSKSADESFNHRVLGWVQRTDQAATEVAEVKAWGSHGDTEGGFYSTFTVDIRYYASDKDDGCKYLTVEGDDMESLWKWVVNSDVWDHPDDE